MAVADVAVVGQICRDLVLEIDELPQTGDSGPVRTRREQLGGKGANQAVAFSQLGMSAALLSGRPEFSPQALRDRVVRLTPPPETITL